MSEMTYLEAISDGLREEMRRDDSVFCLGEDIGVFGGAFKVTAGFHEEFGAERVLDMPLAENLIIGAAVGAAAEGMRPVCEMQFADFIACGFDQLVNVAAKLHYRQGVAVPMVVRLPTGGGFSGGPFHSQNPEAWFLQAPGPEGRRARDGGGREGAAGERDPRSEPGHVPRAQAPVPARAGRGARGRAHGADRRGPRRARGRRADDLRLRLDGRRSPQQAAEELDEDVEIVDLRTLCPLDRDTILASARKTGKVLIAHEATRSCGVGAEVAALIGEEAFEDLDAPVRRLTAPDVPIPFSPPLEQHVLPGLDDMKEAARELLAY